MRVNMQFTNRNVQLELAIGNEVGNSQIELPIDNSN